MAVSPNLVEALRVQATEPGSYLAVVPTDWNAPVFPSGGVTSALALRAMEAELGQPHQRLRSFSTMFVATVGSGAIEIAVEKLRTGKRMSQLRADVHSPGNERPGHLVTAAFGETREGFEFQYARAPDVGPPLDYPTPAVPPPGAPVFRAPFFENIEVRRVKMFSSFESGWESGSAEAIRWLRYRTAPRLADGRIDPLSLIGLADTMPVAISQHLGPGYPFFHAPSVDLSMRMIADTDDEWVLVRSVCHWTGDGYASAENLLWDEHGRLLAHATQMMLIRLVTPEDFSPR